MVRYFKDEGIVLTKRNLLKDDKSITIFSKKRGKITLIGKGIRKITSRRLSHLETGNFIKFSFFQKNDFSYLHDTELILSFAKIRESSFKIYNLYLILFFLKELLPENEKEPLIFTKTLKILEKLNDKDDFEFSQLYDYLKEILIIEGFIDKNAASKKDFNPIIYLERLINQKIAIFNY